MPRTNVMLPVELLAEVDALVGPHSRNAYVEEAVAQRVKRDRLQRAFRRVRGGMAGKPGHRTPDEVRHWVQELRSHDRDG